MSLQQEQTIKTNQNTTTTITTINQQKQQNHHPLQQQQQQQQQQQTSSSSKTKQDNNKQRRPICSHCHRPTPRACICPSLPSSPLTLSHCRIIVLQHPHEKRRKNRSLPLIELCFVAPTRKNNEDLRIVVGRRLGDDTVDDDIREIISGGRHDVILVYPCDEGVSLGDGLEELRRRRQERRRRRKQSEEKQKDINATMKGNTPVVGLPLNPKGSTNTTENEGEDDRITLLFLDATWKYAKEMEKANTSLGLWPKDLIRVTLSPSTDGDCHDVTTTTTTTHTIDDDNKLPLKNSSSSSSITSQPPQQPQGYKPRRFDIRTPPSEKHLSTAETIAWVVSVVENNADVYQTMMKPLDYMVAQWHSFGDVKKKRGDNNGGCGDDDREGRKRKKLFD